MSESQLSMANRLIKSLDQLNMTNKKRSGTYAESQ